MSDESPHVVKGRRGNPNMAKGAPSINPKGRPRKSLAFSEKILAKFPDDEMIDWALAAIRDPKVNWRERIDLFKTLLLRSQGAMPQTTNLNVKSSGEVGLPPMWDRMTDDERDAWFDAATEAARPARDEMPEPEMVDLLEMDE